MTRAAFSLLVTEGLVPGGRQLCAGDLPHPRGQVMGLLVMKEL